MCIRDSAYAAEWVPPDPELKAAEGGDGDDDDDDDDSDDDEWHMHVPGGAAGGGGDASKPDLFRGFTFRREASWTGAAKVEAAAAAAAKKEPLTRTASRMKRANSKLK